MSQTMTRPTAGRVAPVKKRPKRQLPFPLNLYQTAVGKKWVMALTGIGLLGFILAHMLGNLHLYEGPRQVNAYAEHLRELLYPMLPKKGLLWIMRIGLIVMAVLHIHSAYGLTRMNQAANQGAKYQDKRDYIAANFASRTMRWTGLIIGLFVLFHLADLTWGWWLGDTFVYGQVYNNVAFSLSRVPVAIVYIVANVALAVHVYHGAWSMFQSLGINNPFINKGRRHLATALAAVILIGNVSFPVMTLAGVIDDTDPVELHSDATATTQEVSK